MLTIVEAQGQNPGLSIAVTVILLYVFYMFAAFIAEAHGFEHIGMVMAGMFGVLITLALVFVVLLTLAGVEVEP